jgi:hypothetical protein
MLDATSGGKLLLTRSHRGQSWARPHDAAFLLGAEVKGDARDLGNRIVLSIEVSGVPRALRRWVIHNHTREGLPVLLAHADAWAQHISGMEVLL